MANYNFNGTTLSFAGSLVGRLISLNFDESITEVDVSAADEDVVVEPGQSKISLTAEIVGGTSLLSKAKGAIAIVWADGSSSPPLAHAVLVGKAIKGSKNSPISTTLKFSKTNA